MKFIIVFSFSLLFLVTFISCDANEPLPQGAVGLTLEDVSCTEAWMTLTAGNLSNTAYIRLTGNGKLLETLDVNSVKTTLYFDTLQPNTTYEFQAFSSQRGEEIVGNKLQFTTLDTTSHNFTWQTFTFGEHSSSTFFDVAIINDNNIWAVGKIYMNDSIGNPDPQIYNAIHWNGQVWESKKIKTNACGGVDYPPIKAIFAFSENDILFAHIDGSISRFNGIEFINDCSLITQLNGSVNKIWGISKTDFYVVSGHGFIAHYQNGNWTKIESGINLEIQDVWGVSNIENNQQQIYCIASDKYHRINKKVYSIINNSVTEISNEGLTWSLSSIWFNNKYKCYIVGDGIFTKNLSSLNSWQDITLGITPYYTHAIRGTGLNEIVVGGSFGELLHFNGSTWYSYKGRGLPDFIGNYFAVGIKGNVVCSVGQATINSNVAIITLGIRK